MFDNLEAPPKWLGAIFALIGVGTLAYSCFEVQQELTILRDWPTIEAEVLNSKVTMHGLEEGGTAYGVRVEFRFKLNGNEYKASADRHRGYSTPFYSSMQRMTQRFSQGTRHPVRYNPQEPTEVRFNAGYTLEFFEPVVFLAAVGLTFLFFGLISLRKEQTVPP